MSLPNYSCVGATVHFIIAIMWLEGCPKFSVLILLISIFQNTNEQVMFIKVGLSPWNIKKTFKLKLKMPDK